MLSETRPDLSGTIADVVAKSLAKKPDDRFQTAAEFADALRPFADARASLSNEAPPGSSPALSGLTPETPPVQSMAVPQAQRRGGPGAGLQIGVAAACLVAGVLIAVVVMRFLLP